LIKLKEGSHTLTLEESAVAFNTFFLEKMEKIKSKIQSGGLDPLEHTRRRAQKLGIKKNSFVLRTVKEKYLRQLGNQKTLLALTLMASHLKC
jgi:hypothetical protein